MSKALSLALVGNPNVGKSVIFNYLTGMYVDVSNYPGTTIDIAKAPFKFKTHPQKSRTQGLQNDDEGSCWVSQDDQTRNKRKAADEALGIELEVVDTPGVYGLSSFNDEERTTKDFVLNADVIVNVVSAISLERDLFLTKQLADIGKPMILVINQIDEAETRHLEIDIHKLGEELGVTIITSVATKTIGLDSIKDAVVETFGNDSEDYFRAGKLSAEIDKYIRAYEDQVLTRAEALLIAEGDIETAQDNGIKLENAQESREQIYALRRQKLNELIAQVLSRRKFSKRDFLGRILLNPWIGTIVGVTVLYLFLYKFLGVYIAGDVVDFIEIQLFEAHYEPFIRSSVSNFIPLGVEDFTGNIILSDFPRALGTMLAGKYGILTLTVTYLIALLMPLVIGFYFGLAVLEDSGYLPRLAVLVDGLLSRFGMNGRAIIPLILGGGCVTMATVTTRLLKSNKEKIITMALLGLTIPCSAQLGVIQGLLTQLGGVTPWLLWSGTLFIIFALVGLVMNKLMPGECGHFVSDLPPMRLPVVKNIIFKTYTRSKVFFLEAVPAFFAASTLVSFLQVTGLLEQIIDAFEPVISNVLLLPGEVTLSFILGMVRRDFGAFGLMDIEMSAVQIVTSCLVLTLFVPCIATVAIMIKEKNFQTALAIWLSSWFLAFGFGAVFARFLGNIL